jgi:hypothetical protein
MSAENTTGCCAKAHISVTIPFQLTELVGEEVSKNLNFFTEIESNGIGPPRNAGEFLLIHSEAANTKALSPLKASVIVLNFGTASAARIL